MYYTSYLHSLITQLCEDDYPQWWFPTKPVKNQGDHILTIADCLGLSEDHLSTIFSLLRTKWSYLQKHLQRKYNLLIPHISIYDGNQSQVKTWICFGPFPASHSPHDQVFLHIACPSSTYKLLRRNASYYHSQSSTLSNDTTTLSDDPNIALLLIFIFVFCYLNTILLKLNSKSCIGINADHDTLMNLFEHQPLLFMKKWHYLRGFRSKRCPLSIFGKGNTCQACMSSNANFSRDYRQILSKSSSIIENINELGCKAMRNMINVNTNVSNANMKVIASIFCIINKCSSAILNTNVIRKTYNVYAKALMNKFSINLSKTKGSFRGDLKATEHNNEVKKKKNSNINDHENKIEEVTSDDN